MNSDPRSSIRVWHIALAVFALAFAIRLIHVLEIRPAPFFSLRMGDARSYDEWARQIAAGDWIGRGVFYQAPLYPYFLGVVYRLLGRDLLTLRIVQALVGSLSCVLLLLAGRRFFSLRAGIAAGVTLALWAPAIFFDGLVQKSVLDVFFVCLSLWSMSRCSPAADDSGTPATITPWLALGASIGALALTRENALVFVIVLAAWAAFARSGSSRSHPRRAAVFLAGVAVVVAPVAIRNSVLGGGFYVTTSQFGPNFYIGNNARADGTYASLRFGRGAPEYERQDATELAERAEGRRLSPSEVSSYWTTQALDFITGRPGAWLKLMMRKFELLWNRTEMVDTESQETHAEWSWPLRVLGPVTHFGVLVPLALLGAIVSWRSSGARVLTALIAAYAGSVLMFYVFARYRYPLVPVLILFAAAGLTGGVRRSLPFQIHRRRSLAFAGAVVAAAVFANWPVIPRDWLRAVSENNIAVALQAEGRHDEAIAHYQRAVSLRADYAPALNNMATALRAAGRVDAAVATFERALAVRSDYPEAHYNLGNALTDAGRRGEAVAHFQRALDALPPSADVHNNFGIALAGEGRVDDAIAQFREAVRIDPQSAKARRNLGDALLSRGAAEEGLDAMRDAVALAPDDGALRYDFGSALLEAGKIDAAIAELREAVQRLPASAEARNNLGVALGSNGRLDEAVVQFSEAVRLRPDFADARRNLEMAAAARRSPKAGR